MKFINRSMVFAVAGILTGLSLFSSTAFAQLGPSNLNVSGFLFQSNGQPVSGNVNFKIEIYDKNSTCVLYSEDHNAQDLSASKGGFSIQIGEGTSKSNKIDAGSSTALSSKVFQNTGAIAPYAGCASGLTLTPGDNRMLRVWYNTGSGMTAMSPDVPMSSAAFSMVADTLQGKTPSNFVQVRDDATYDLNQTNVESIFSAANFAKLTAILSGNVSNQRLTNVTDPTAASDAATKGYADANVGGKVGDFTGVGPATGNGKTLIWDQTQNKWVTGVPSATDATKLPLAGGTMTGAIDMGGQNFLNVGHITMAAQKTLNLGTYTNAQETTLIATPLTAADKGKIWFNSSTNKMMVWDGSAAVDYSAVAGAAGGDLTGTYPNPTIGNNKVIAAAIASSAVTTAKLNAANAVAGGTLMMVDTIDTSRVEYKSCALGQALMWTAGGWACTSVSSLLGNSGVTAATYGSATQVAQVTVDAQGRVTNASNVAITFPVISVAGKTGAVTLNIGDITNAGTAATKDFGAAAGNLVELDGAGKIPAGLMPGAMGDIQDVVAGSGLTGGGSSGAVTLTVDTGVTTGKIVQMAASDKLPAVDGSNLTNVNAVKLQARDIAATAPAANEVLMWNNGTSVWEPKAVPSAPVSSVATKTGAVTLDWGDILNAASKYFGYRPNNVACASGEILKWNNGASYWECGTDLDSGGDVQSVTAGAGATGGGVSGAITIGVDVGVTTGKIVQMAASDKLPAVDGSSLIQINAVKLQTRNVSATAPTANQVLKWNNGTSVWEPAADTDTTTTIQAGTGLTGGVITTNGTVAVDVGVTNGKIIQVGASDRLPAVDGRNLTFINAVQLQSRDVSSAAPSADQVLTWNGSTSVWESRALPAGNIGDITSVANGTGLTGGGANGDVTLNIDVGVTTGKIVQMAASNKLPAIDGSNLVGLTASQISGAFANGGNSFGAAATLGTNDNFALNFEANNATAMTILAGGNVGVGTTNPTTPLEVIGAMTARSSSGVHHYNVHTNYLGAAGQTGTLKINLPTAKYLPATMLHIVIRGFDYSGAGAWEAHIGGYPYTDGNTYNYSASILGRAPFNQVRWAQDGTRNVILLGTTSTVWTYATIEISDVHASYGNYATGWGTGWSSALITSEAGITNVFTPTLDVFTNSGGNVGIGTNNPTAKLHIGGTAGTDGIRFPDGTLQTTAATGSSSWSNITQSAVWSTSGVAGYVSVGNISVLNISVTAGDLLFVRGSCDVRSPDGSNYMFVVLATTGLTHINGGSPNQVTVGSMASTSFANVQGAGLMFAPATGTATVTVRAQHVNYSTTTMYAQNCFIGYKRL